MSRIPGGSKNWYAMPASWDMDADLIDLPDSTVLLFLKLVDLCQRTRNGGKMALAQVLTVARSVHRGRQSIERLLLRGCLVIAPPLEDHCSVIDWSLLDHCSVIAIAKPSHWMLYADPSSPIPAAQQDRERANSVQAEKPRARKEREIEREKESIRSPSGSDRMDSARAVPRSAGGAARPAPVAGCWQGDTVDDDEPDDDLTRMSLAEKKAAARNAIREGQRKGPATGKDVTFSRYDPNRKIVPLTSGFKIDGGAE